MHFCKRQSHYKYKQLNNNKLLKKEKTKATEF